MRTRRKLLEVQVPLPRECFQLFMAPVLDGDAALPVLRESRGGPASKRRTVGGASAAADSVMYVGNSVVRRPLSIYHVSQGGEPLFGNARPRRSAFADGCGLLRS